MCDFIALGESDLYSYIYNIDWMNVKGFGRVNNYSFFCDLNDHLLDFCKLHGCSSVSDIVNVVDVDSRVQLLSWIQSRVESYLNELSSDVFDMSRSSLNHSVKVVCASVQCILQDLIG